jgi:hypothetical protein
MSVMHTGKTSNWLRLMASPTLLLAIACFFCALPIANVPRDHVPSLGSQPYADAGTNRAKVLRPARVQARVPQSSGADGKSEQKAPGNSLLLASGISIQVDFIALGSACAATNVAPDPFRVRTRNPRDPPECLI